MVNFEFTKWKVIKSIVLAFILSWILIGIYSCLGASFCLIAPLEIIIYDSIAFIVPLTILFIVIYTILSLIQKKEVGRNEE